MTANIISYPKSHYTGIEISYLQMQGLIRIYIRERQERVQTLYDTIYIYIYEDWLFNWFLTKLLRQYEMIRNTETGGDAV